MVKKRYSYGVNRHGHPLGEAHPNAKLTDEQVEQIRTLYENGGTSYRQIAKLFGVPRSTISDICSFRRRACTPADYRTKVIEVKEGFTVTPGWWKLPPK
jgi:DNA invertase Pin-like site-specific DNA recombinase